MNKLKEVVNFLNTKNISISEEHDDGRINSVVDEKTIINILKEEYGSENIIEPPARHWWDVKVFGFPINIKVSAFNKQTNEVILQGLKTLTKLTPNGNNLLFQINWNNNQTIVNRTHEDAYNFLVGAYKESVKKKVSVHAGYETL